MRCGGIRTIQSKQLKIYTVDILGREAWQKATRSTEEKSTTATGGGWGGRGGGALCLHKSQCITAL